MEHDALAKVVPADATAILGRSLAEFAPCIAALNDLEEMARSLIHPLVQVYSIPRTGRTHLQLPARCKAIHEVFTCLPYGHAVRPGKASNSSIPGQGSADAFSSRHAQA